MPFITFFIGLAVYAFIRVLATGFYTVKPDERAVVSTFGKANRLPGAPAPEETLSDDERERYHYPSAQVIRPGGPYFKWPWQRVHKVSIATQVVEVTWDPTKDQDTIESVTTLPPESTVRSVTV